MIVWRPSDPGSNPWWLAVTSHSTGISFLASRHLGTYTYFPPIAQYFRVGRPILAEQGWGFISELPSINNTIWQASRKRKRPGVWTRPGTSKWLRGLDLNQRPSGY